MIHRTSRLAYVAALVVACLVPAAQAQPSPALVAQLHANAVISFQQGRLPEAYGLFIALADASHAPLLQPRVYTRIAVPAALTSR